MELYLKRTYFRVYKFSRISRILGKFAKLNTREKFFKSGFAKINTREKSFIFRSEFHSYPQLGFREEKNIFKSIINLFKKLFNQ